MTSRARGIEKPFPILFLCLTALSETCASAQEVVELTPQVSAEARLLGKPLLVRQRSLALASQMGIATQTQVQFLGQSHDLIESSIEALTPANPESPIQANSDLYLGGTRVWSGQLRFENGGLKYSGGIAPTQIPFPVFVYPLGPLVIRVDAGVEFEGAIEASLTPGFSYPFPDSTIDARLQANLAAAVFLEGYASLWVARGGVGGRVNLIEGQSGIDAHFYLNGHAPTGKNFGKVRMLNGAVYGFVDTHFFFGRWARVYRKNFYQWDGLCHSFGAESCELN